MDVSVCAYRRCKAVFLLISALSISACSGKEKSGSKSTAVLETDLGGIKIELLQDDAPKTVENFKLLAERGYYNGTIFHRVVNGFMIQGGDPRGNGTGGETASGAPLPNEINRSSPLYQAYRRGVVAMANKGRPETATSQFFIMHGDRPLNQLAPNYTIFGRVVDGMDVVDRIATAPTTTNEQGERSRPVTPVRLKKVSIE